MMMSMPLITPRLRQTWGKMFSLQWSDENQTAQENWTRIKLRWVCICCVRSCSLCLLPGPSSNFLPGLWVDNPDPPLSLSPSSPLPLALSSPHGPAHCPLIILCSVTHWCLHLFIHSFTEKISESLITLISLIHLLPLFLLFPQNHFVLTTLLIYISASTHLV